MLRYQRPLVRRAVTAATTQSAVTPARSRALHCTRATRSAWPVGSSDADEGEPTPTTSSSSGSQERRSGRLQQTAPIDRTDAGNSKTRQKLEMPKSQPAKTLLQLLAMKQQRKPIACLTAYDYPTALSLRNADIDICLVGDSLANVALGHASTQSLTLDATIHHCQAVHRGLFSPLLSVSSDTPGAPLLVADVPFGSFQTSEEQGMQAAVRLLKEGGVDAVKIEGGQEILPLVRRLTQFGIPVMGHLGLQPQRVGSSAGYRLQGRTADEAHAILTDALALQDAGVFSIVLECIPNKVGQVISDKLAVPTIGIGAGPLTDGQILVTNDMLGELTSPWHVLSGLDSQGDSHTLMPSLATPVPQGPKFVRNFVAQLVQQRSRDAATTTDLFNPGHGIGALRLAAVQEYVRAVRDRSFPDENREGYKIKSDEFKEFLRRVEATQ